MSALQQGVYFTGLAGDYVSSPDAAALDITGPLDIRAESSQHVVNGADLTILSKWNEGTNNRSYELYEAFFFIPGAALRWSTNGTVVVAPAAGFVTNVMFEALSAMRCTLIPATGATVFAYSQTIDGPWGKEQEFVRLEGSSGATAIFSGSGELAIGAIAGGASRNYKGFIKRVRIYNGIGPPEGNAVPVLDADLTKWPAGSTTMVAATGQTLTLQGFVLTAAQGNAFRERGIDTPASNVDLSREGGGVEIADKVYSTAFHGWRHFIIDDMVSRGYSGSIPDANSLFAQIK